MTMRLLAWPGGRSDHLFVRREGWGTGPAIYQYRAARRLFMSADDQLLPRIRCPFPRCQPSPRSWHPAPLRPAVREADGRHLRPARAGTERSIPPHPGTHRPGPRPAHRPAGSCALSFLPSTGWPALGRPVLRW